MRIGDGVITPDGEGVIQHIEEYSRLGGLKRFGVELKTNTRSYPVVYYWRNEITGHEIPVQRVHYSGYGTEVSSERKRNH